MRTRTSNSRRSRISLGLILSLSLGTLLVGVGATPAQATCPEPGYPLNTVGAPNGTSWLGVRVSGPGMDIFDGDVDCGRVSSVFVLNSTGTRWVEVGWYENPSGAGVDYSCIPASTGAPRILAYSYDNGTSNCKTTGADLSAGTSGFYVQDKDTDGVWKFFRDGTQVWTSPDMTPFASGMLQSNGERLDFGNTSHAVFDGLGRMKTNGTWENWDSTSEHAWSDDSQAHFCKYSNIYTEVKLTGTAC